MQVNTLNIYLFAGGLSICLSLLLAAFAYFQPGTRLLKSCAVAILMLSVGFTVFGFSPNLPRWMTVMGANMLLISAAVVWHAAFVAYGLQQAVKVDWMGWGIVAMTALPFWYWGLVEPDGQLRAGVFSMALAAVTVRTTWVLAGAARRQTPNTATWALALLFGVLTLWMTARGVMSLGAQTPEPSVRGANPTAWTTVFWYIIFVSVMTVCFIWLELSRPASTGQEPTTRSNNTSRLVGFFHHRLYLLWGTVLVLVLSIVSEAGVFYTQSYLNERARLTQSAELANDAFVQHTQLVISQVDTLLNAVRGFYQHTRSVTETEVFINALPFDKLTIDNIYLISAQASLLIAHDPAAAGRSLAGRDYFLFHSTQSADQMFISSVETGRVTGLQHFRITRRINHADGSFAGIILATVNPESFARYYREMAVGDENIASLLGTLDKKLRARAPAPPNNRWQASLESHIWAALERAPAGVYESASSVDDIHRIFAYKKVGDLPLVMVTGFSDADVRASLRERSRWLIVGSLSVVVVILFLATLLTVEIRRRDEQDRFMSMLSHELKTPLSVVSMTLGLQQTPSASVQAHAQEAVRDIQAVVDRCLQVDRLRHRRGPKPQRIDLPHLLAECCHDCTQPERLQIEAPDIPTLTTDELSLRTIVSNLIDNALKYAASGSPVQVTAWVQAKRGQPGVILQVRNTVGPAGHPDPRRLFQKYYRSPGAHRMTGSGLGLYLVRGLLKGMGGRIDYRAQDSACVFELWLPLANP